MEENERDYVASCIADEGLDYTFMHYSTFNDIRDSEFHKLRLAYCDAATQLLEYVGEPADIEQELDDPEDDILF